MAYGVAESYGVVGDGEASDYGVLPNYGTGGLSVSGSESAFSGTFSVAADDTDLSVTFTARNDSGNPVEGYTPSLTVDVGDVSASLSTVNASSLIPAINTPITIYIGLRDAQNNPVVDFAAANIVVSATGTNNTITQPTGATDKDGLITASYQASTTGARTITVTVASLALSTTLAVDVGAVAGVEFASEWTTATGTTEAAFRDGTLWPTYNGTLGNGAAEIVASDASLTGRGNYYRVNNAGTNSLVVYGDLVPESTTWYGRVYFRGERTTGVHNHFVNIGGVGGNPIQWALGGSANGSGELLRVTQAAETDGTPLVSPFVRWSPGNVDNASAYDRWANGDWYLIEWRIEYLTATTYHVDYWISEVDATGTITTQDKWTNTRLYQGDYPGSGTQNLSGFIAAEPVFGLTGTAAQARRVMLGNEGPASGTTDSGYFLLASFGISLDGRLGDMDIV